MTPAEHTELRHRLLAQGYTPLAAKGKRCVLKNWPRLDVDTDTVDEWAARSGLVTTGVRVDDDLLVLDFDIDCTEVLGAIEARILDEDADLWDLMLQMPKRMGGGVKYALFCRRKTGKFEQYWSKAYYRPADVRDDRNKAPRQRLEVFSGGGSEGRFMALYGAHTVTDAGDIVRSYAWDDGWGLADIPKDELPGLTLKQVKWLVDVASEAMHKAKWIYEVGSVHGKVVSSVAYTLLPEMTFNTNKGERLSLAELEESCDDLDLRVDLSFVETKASNVTRGSVRRNPSDGRVQIKDFATACLYRPAELDIHLKGRSLGEALARNPHLSGSGPSSRLFALDPANQSDGDERPFVAVGEGDLTEASKFIAEYLAGQTHLFDMGGRIVGVLDGRLVPMEQDRLAVEIGRRVCCRTEQQIGNAIRLVEVDPSVKLVKLVASLLLESRFKTLRAITDVPVLRRGGEIVEDGYCPETQLVVRAVDGVSGRVPAAGDIGKDDLRGALGTLWKPFRAFPFVGPLDRGGMLAALLTAVLRPVLPTAPAFGFDAPVQGSGKSLLSRCVGRLAGSFKVYAPLPVKDDDEVRKVLLTVLMESPRAAVFDNMLGLLDSGALGAVLTSETFSGRVLGTNTSLHAPTSVLIMLNGNNLALAGDMPRRVVSVRIDPQHEVPHSRSFDFDPEQEVRTNRADMLVAALTLVRAALPSARRGRVGSFEIWDEMIGQTVRWIRDNLDNRFGDPADSIQQAVEFDPRREELSVLVTLLRQKFGNEWFSAHEVAAEAGRGVGLAEAMDMDRSPSARSIGRYLANRKDGRAGGLTLQHRKDSVTKVAKFRIWSEEDAEGVVVSGQFQRRDPAVAKLENMKPKAK
jgi:hypothetical protein